MRPSTEVRNVVLGSLELIQRLKLCKKLAVHKGCVNSVQWNDTGTVLLSGSDDQHLVITHGHRYKVSILVEVQRTLNCGKNDSVYLAPLI